MTHKAEKLVNPPFVTGTLTTLERSPQLDLDLFVGQLSATYRFTRFNGTTGEVLSELHPVRNASLSHDTTRTIKRQLQLTLGAEDTEAINPITDRVEVFMVFSDGTEFPLGRYMFTDASYELFTSGRLSHVVLNDEMFLVDQQAQNGVDAVALGTGLAALGSGVADVIVNLLQDLPVQFSIEQSSFFSIQSWTAGTRLGQVLEALSLTGDYFSPWFDNTGVLRFIRAFDPAKRVPDFDWDRGNKIYQATTMDTNNVLTAPNRFVVISNAAGDQTQAVVGVADVPFNTPYSFAQRGFYIPQIVDLQLSTIDQAQAVAENLVQRQTIFERTEVVTNPDPRHDSYNVIHWREQNWLEIAWTMALTEGGHMSHVLRKAYL